MRSGDYVFVHAGVRPGVSAREAASGRPAVDPRRVPARPAGRCPGKVVVHGHTICDLPQDRGHRINIDTGAFVSGRLTCLVLRGTRRQFLSTLDVSRPPRSPHANVSGPCRTLTVAGSGPLTPHGQERQMTTLRSLLAGTVALVASLAFVADALAQTQTQAPPASPPTRLRGTITAIDGKTATIATREGTSVPVKLADNWVGHAGEPDDHGRHQGEQLRRHRLAEGRRTAR